MPSFVFPPGRCALVGMVHLKPLPGSPGWGGSMASVVEAAVEDAQKLRDGGVDAFIVENMGDLPYLPAKAGPETVAAMSVVCSRVASLGIPFGVQILAGANLEALAVAMVTQADFVRVEAFAYAHVADEGWLDACAGELLRKRRELGAGEIRVWADVQKKHAAHAVTRDLSLAELSKGTAFCGADALVVTGLATGEPTRESDVADARAGGLPVLVGSGVTEENAASLAKLADGLIVGSSLKRNGDWRGPVEVERVRAVRAAMST